MSSHIVSSVSLFLSWRCPSINPSEARLARIWAPTTWLWNFRTESGDTGLGYSTSLDRRGTKAVVSYIKTDLIPLAIGSRRDPTGRTLATDVVSQ